MSIPEFKLDAFEGPLDLLLHLIAKHKLNIYDIEISLLLEQYLEYIEGLEEQDFDSAGDFLAMAARLVYIKTCSLLPQPEEAEEMKKELQGELLDYSACKAAAQRLSRQSVYGDVFVRPPEKLPVNKVFTGTIDPAKLVEAYLGMSAKARSMRPVRAEQFTPLVRSRFVTVTSKIIHVLKRLLRSGECTISELYEDITDKSSRVATFLAVLELAKSGRIMLNDDNTLISFNRSAPRKHPQTDNTAVTAAGSDSAEEESLCDEHTDDLYDTAEDTAETADDTENECGTLSAAADETPAGMPSPEKERPFRIALETMAARHSLAIPAFVLFNDPPAAEQSAAAHTAETKAQLPPYIQAEICVSQPENTAAADKTYDIPAEKTDDVHPDIPVLTEDREQSDVPDNDDKIKWINRFAVRRYWGFPKDKHSAWRYRRERL